MIAMAQVPSPIQIFESKNSSRRLSAYGETKIGNFCPSALESQHVGVQDLRELPKGPFPY